ncbi:MAG: hypothetical protein L6V85_01180 [Clostridiales bacterium]|nr:MAG: hypothetical protein L6V85_01180 [Clostridiales bacterium]
MKTTAFLTDLSNFATFNEIYASYFVAPYPARSCVEVSKLPKKTFWSRSSASQRNNNDKQKNNGIFKPLFLTLLQQRLLQMFLLFP